MSYPVFINLKDVNIVFVGGGRIARRKMMNVLGQGANVTVVAPQIIDEIKEIARNSSEVKLIEKPFKLDYVLNATLVFVVSDNEEVNQEATEYCIANGILLNNCMDRSKSSFRNGAVIRKDDLEVAIGTGGNRPGVSKWLKESIGKSIPDSVAEVMHHYDDLRAKAKVKFSSSKEREQYIKEAFKEYIDNLEGIDHEN